MRNLGWWQGRLRRGLGGALVTWAVLPSGCTPSPPLDADSDGGAARDRLPLESELPGYCRGCEMYQGEDADGLGLPSGGEVARLLTTAAASHDLAFATRPIWAPGEGTWTLTWSVPEDVGTIALLCEGDGPGCRGAMGPRRRLRAEAVVRVAALGLTATWSGMVYGVGPTAEEVEIASGYDPAPRVSSVVFDDGVEELARQTARGPRPEWFADGDDGWTWFLAVWGNAAHPAATLWYVPPKGREASSIKVASWSAP